MRRSIAISGLILSVALGCWAGKQPETLEQLKARAEATTGERQPLLFAEVVQREIDAADKLFTDGYPEKAHAMVKDAVVYAEKARDASVALPSKKMKEVEIALRKAENRLIAIRRTAALEDQADLQAAADRLGQIRTEILNQMFAPKRK